MLHRDISPNNLMWAPGGSDGARVERTCYTKQQGQPSGDVGYLIDLDFAAIVEAGTAEQIGVDDVAHTLALPFLAIDHLPPDTFIDAQSPLTPITPGHHIYRHDLESFFWSLWWILLKEVRDQRADFEIDQLFLHWQSPNLGENRVSKSGFLVRSEGWSKTVSRRLWQQHKHCAKMEGFLISISETFRLGYRALEQGDDYMTAGGYITFNNFTGAFPRNDR